MTHPLFAVHEAATDAFRVQTLWVVAGRDGTLALEAGTAGLDSPEIDWVTVASLRDAENHLMARLAALEDPDSDDPGEPLLARLGRQARDIAARTRRGFGNTVLVPTTAADTLRAWNGQPPYSLRLDPGPAPAGSRFARFGRLGDGATTLWLDTAAAGQPIRVAYAGRAGYDRPLLYVDRGGHGHLGYLRAAGRSAGDWAAFFGAVRA